MPKANLVGCTPDQSDVARMMVRMRQIHRVTDVKLNQSTTELGDNTEISRQQLRQVLPVQHHPELLADAAWHRGAAWRVQRAGIPRRRVMNISERDRKIAIAIVPILLLVGYWFLLLAPKRDAAAEASKELTKQTQRRDKAQTAANAARGAKTDFAADYAEIVRLGKAIPSGVDMPSLLVQLDRAAEGTGIRFTKVGAGRAH